VSLPRVLVTGSSGFLGRHLLDELKSTHRIFGIARRTPAFTGAPLHQNITWFQVDIRDRQGLRRAFRRLAEEGGVETVVHLAAYYDFTGERHPDYQRTNIDGLRNVLDECRHLPLRRFIFASSVAASDFRAGNRVVNESTPADGTHHYAVSKRVGEAMLEEYEDEIPTCIVRFAALFSDWCEYPPLFKFLETWLSNNWRRRFLGGKGQLGVPYLDVREAVRFLVRLMRMQDTLEPNEILIASTDGSVTTRQLFEDATLHYYGSAESPVYLPRELSRVGIYCRDRFLGALGDRPFERAWMASYFDRRLDVDASQTRRRLDWRPRERLSLRRRLPFMIENLKCEPMEWYRRNHMAMRMMVTSVNLRVHRLLEKHEENICDTMAELMTNAEGRVLFPTYQALTPEEREWNYRVAIRHLLDSVRTRDKSIYGNFCRDLAELRFAQGFHPPEVREALRLFRDVCLGFLHSDEDAVGLAEGIEDHVFMTMLYGCDQIEDALDHLTEAAAEKRSGPPSLDPQRLS
jgi:nucleoside-diphosphate-sugar epimerase